LTRSLGPSAGSCIELPARYRVSVLSREDLVDAPPVATSVRDAVCELL
jgi:hypothetical protein